MPNSAFTLIELVIVITIIGIISIIAIPNLFDFSSDAREAVTREEMNAIKRAITGDSRVVAGGNYVFRGYEADMGGLPSKLSDLVKNPATGDTTQDYNPLTRSGWRGPYVDNSSSSDYSTDAWGTPYTYSSAGRYIRSLGPNKTDDGGSSDDIELNF